MKTESLSARLALYLIRRSQVRLIDLIKRKLLLSLQPCIEPVVRGNSLEACLFADVKVL